MALSRSETIEKANSCTKTAVDIQLDVGKIQVELANFQSDILGVSKNISGKLQADDITTGCTRCLSGVSKNVEECSLKMNEYLKSLAKDCNDYIAKIEKEYNDDLEKRKKEAKEKKKDEITEERLNLKRVKLESNGTFSLVTEEGLQKTETTKVIKGNKNSNTFSSNNGLGTSTTNNGYTQSFIDSYRTQLDYILGHNLTASVDSSTINNWNSFIFDFIKINNFESTVQSISLSNGKVKCVLKNGSEYNFSNIHNFNELADAIKKVV